MTAFFISDWHFSADVRRQLVSKISQAAINDLESELNVAQSLLSAQPPRRQMIASIKVVRDQLAKIGDSFSGISLLNRNWVCPCVPVHLQHEARSVFRFFV